MRSADPNGPTAPAPDVDLDCRGLLCPLPVIETRRALERLARGEVLRVVTTDPAADLDMAAFSSTSGHPIVARERDGEALVFFLRKA